jgi:hypothetical protein
VCCDGKGVVLFTGMDSVERTYTVAVSKMMYGKYVGSLHQFDGMFAGFVMT